MTLRRPEDVWATLEVRLQLQSCAVADADIDIPLFVNSLVSRV
jgi:hypothetical protein